MGTVKKNLSLPDDADAALIGTGNASAYVAAIVLLREKAWQTAIQVLDEAGLLQGYNLTDIRKGAALAERHYGRPGGIAGMMRMTGLKGLGSAIDGDDACAHALYELGVELRAGNDACSAALFQACIPRKEKKGVAP